MVFKFYNDVSSLGIKVVFLVIFDIDNTTYDVDLEKSISMFYENFYRTCSLEDLEQDNNIIGYRQLHKNICLADKSLIASPESLIKVLLKHKTLRPINFIVDIYNYVAIKNRVSIGAHDIEKVSGNVRLCIANGDELFVPLGKKSPQAVNAGEYCYIDDSNEIICRLDCRQCDKTKITSDTKNCLFIIQGHNKISAKTLTATAEEIQNLLNLYTTGEKQNILKVI